MSDIIQPVSVFGDADPSQAFDAGALQAYREITYLPQVLRFDFDVTGVGDIQQSRIPVRPCTLTLVRFYAAFAWAPSSFTFDIVWRDDALALTSIWANPADRLSVVSGTLPFVERAPTRLDLPVFDSNVNRGQFLINITNHTGVTWPGVTVELVLTPTSKERV